VGHQETQEAQVETAMQVMVTVTVHRMVVQAAVVALQDTHQAHQVVRYQEIQDK
jgi:hypothetical protein